MMPQLQKSKSAEKLSPTRKAKSQGGSSARRSVKSATQRISKVPPSHPYSYQSTSRVASSRRQQPTNQKPNALLHSDSFIETATHLIKSETHAENEFHQISYIQTNTTQGDYRSAATLKNGSPLVKSLKRPQSS